MQQRLLFLLALVEGSVANFYDLIADFKHVNTTQCPHGEHPSSISSCLHWRSSLLGCKKFGPATPTAAAAAVLPPRRVAVGIPPRLQPPSLTA